MKGSVVIAAEEMELLIARAVAKGVEQALRMRAPVKDMARSRLSGHAAAGRADCRYSDFLAAIERGELPAQKVPRGRAYSWSLIPADVDAWTKARK